MSTRPYGFRLRLFLLILFWGMSGMYGCALQRSVNPSRPWVIHPGTPNQEQGDYAWSICRFKIAWSANEAPEGTVDLYLSHSVLKPILDRYADRMHRWRFHRRAVRDKAGHQFSFMFYSGPETAEVVFEEIRQNAQLEKIIASGTVLSFNCSVSDRTNARLIEGTSDSHWSLVVQRNWPDYIMGVSSMWLGMIDDLWLASDLPDGDLAQTLDKYRDIEDKITHIWRKEGRHAFLHHLNALFWYQPMVISNEIRF